MSGLKNAACAWCGEELPEAVKYCGRCGRAQSSAALTLSPRQRALGRRTWLLTGVAVVLAAGIAVALILRWQGRVSFPAEAQPVVEALESGRSADIRGALAESAAALVPPDATLVPDGATVDVDSGTWSDTDTGATVEATGQTADGTETQFVVHLVREGDRWAILYTEAERQP